VAVSLPLRVREKNLGPALQFVSVEVSNPTRRMIAARMRDGRIIFWFG
jgi:hypothetical protein